MTRIRSILATLALVGALLTASGTAASAEIVGTGPGTISGTVTTSDGQPVEAVFVSVAITLGQGTAFWAYTATDAAGHYEFSGLDLGPNYDIRVSSLNFQPTPEQYLTLTSASPSATANFVLLPFAVGVGVLSGHITGDGVPLAYQSVTAYNPVTNQNVYGSTDEAGFYEITGLANGEWTMTGWAGPQYQFLYPASVHLTDAAPSATIDLSFVSFPVGTSAISGVVTDSASGEPLGNVTVMINGIDVAHNSTVWTDETGAYAIDLLPEGTYRLDYWASSYLYSSAEVHVLADQSVTSDRALIARNATISGHVTGPDGAPAVGIYVDANSEDGNFGSASTNANGDYVITGLGAVAYTVNIGGGEYVHQDRVVTAEANATVTANFTLEVRTTGSLGGFVLIDGQNSSLPACVTLYSSKSKKPLGEVVTWGENFGDGTYNFDNLKPGKYTVEARDCDNDPATKFDKVFLGGAKNLKDATFVTVVAGVDNWGNDVTLTVRSSNGHSNNGHSNNGHSNNGHGGHGKDHGKGHSKGHSHDKGHGDHKDNKGKR